MGYTLSHGRRAKHAEATTIVIVNENPCPSCGEDRNDICQHCNGEIGWSSLYGWSHIGGRRECPRTQYATPVRNHPNHK